MCWGCPPELLSCSCLRSDPETTLHNRVHDVSGPHKFVVHPPPLLGPICLCTDLPQDRPFCLNVYVLIRSSNGSTAAPCVAETEIEPKHKLIQNKGPCVTPSAIDRKLNFHQSPLPPAARHGVDHLSTERDIACRVKGIDRRRSLLFVICIGQLKGTSFGQSNRVDLTS